MKVFSDVEKAMDALHYAERRVLLLGRGCLGAVEEVRKFLRLEDASDYHWDVVVSQAAMGAVPGAEMVGHTGTKAANLLVARADAILVLGARLDMRQTGTETQSWDDKIVVRVDIDPAELEHSRVDLDFTFCQDVGEWLREALA